VSGANLLDVNVLLALFWPRHTSHTAARRWFASHRNQKWATCALTQSGFVRLLSNPAITLGLVQPQEALRVLEENAKDSRHEFWPMELPLAEAIRLSGLNLEGHRQVTDLYLLGLASHRGGRLVTFDEKLAKAGRHAILLRG
jgi:toxin-antitoxin system PIN domain toxin